MSKSSTAANNPWRNRFTFLTPVGVTHMVSGHELKFYPISVDLVRELIHFAEPISDAILTLLTPTKTDNGKSVEDIQDGKENVHTQRTIMEGVPVELARFRDEQKRAAVKKLIAALFDPHTQELLGSMIVDSLRDEFTRAQASDPKVIQAFVKGDEDFPGLDARMLVEFLMGLMKANKEVFGPLGLDAARELMARRLSELGAAGDGRSEVIRNLSPVSSGENSPTPSSSQSPEDTTLAGSLS